MKINLIIIILLIGLIINSSYYEYDLTSGSIEHMPTLDIGSTYKFYISAAYDQAVDIEITKQDSSSNFYDQIITIYEYSNRSSTTELMKTNITLSYNYHKRSYSQLYRVNNPLNEYIALEIKPNYQMENVYIKVNVFLYYEFDLTNGLSKYFTTLSNTSIYKFYVPVESSQNVNFQISKNDSTYTNMQYITIYDYTNRNDKNVYKMDFYTMLYNKSENAYSISYVTWLSRSGYVAFEINPNCQMTSVYVKATVKDDIIYYETKTNFPIILLYFILIFFIFIIMLIVYCYIRKKKEKENYLKNYSSPNQINNQYPIQCENYIPPDQP